MEKLFTFEDMLEFYKNNSELSKFTTFDDSDYFIPDVAPLMSLLMKIINEHIFTTEKVLIPTEMKTILGSILGIFNFEFSNYMIIFQNRQQIYSLKMDKFLSSKTLEELNENANSIEMMLGLVYDNSKIMNAIENKDEIRLELLKKEIKDEFDVYFGDGTIIINSIEDFVCSFETCFYEGSFLMNAKKIYKEIFAGFSKDLSPNEKYEYLIKSFSLDGDTIMDYVKYDDIKIEFINLFRKYVDSIVRDNHQNCVLTDSFWNDITNVLVNFLLQFIKEISIEGMFNFKNTKLRIKSSNIIDIMRGLCPRDSLYTISQINFLRYISNTRSNLKQVLTKKYGYVDKEENIKEVPKKSSKNKTISKKH